MRYLFLLFLSMISFSGRTQNSIRGKLFNKNDVLVSMATVQLLSDSSRVAYAISDQNGEFELKYYLTDNSNLFLKITHLQYETKILKISEIDIILKNKIVLSESIIEMQEAVIQARSTFGKLKGDTLSYNLKELTNGSEEKLIDVLKKLPGIEINENGQIISQGKIVSELLINGKSIYGDNHKIVTENLAAEMLDGIQILNNFESFGAIKDIEGSNKTALNVNIKEEFLGKITGTANLMAAYSNRYLLGSNLFKFDKSINISSILNFNNTGYQSISSKDYFSMQKGIKQEMRNNDQSIGLTIPDEIPAFLLSNNNVNTKTNSFASFDLNYQPNIKFAINGYSILSKLNINEKISSSKQFFDFDKNSIIIDSLSNKNKLFFNQSKLNIDFKNNNKSLLNYTANFEFNQSRTNHEILNIFDNQKNNTYENFLNKKYKLGHQVSYIKKISRNQLLSFNLFQEIQNNNQHLFLNANYKLFLIQDSISQSIISHRNDRGFYAKFTKKTNAHILKFSLGYTWESSTFNSINQVFNPNNISNSNNYFNNDISIQKTTGKLHYRVKTQIRNYHINQLYQAWFFLPAIQLKYNIGPTHHIFLNYSRVIDYANVDYLNDNSIIDNFRTIKEPSSLNFSSPYIQNIYSLNYLNLDLYNGLVIFFNSIYTEYESRISNNTQFENNIIKTTNINLANQFSWVNQITLEYRLLGLKNKLKLSANHIQSNFKNEINSKLNTQLIQSFGSKCSVLSSFKSEIFNYEIGYRFNMQSTKFSVFNSANSLLTQNLFINFNGNLNEKWSYTLENLLERYKSEDFTTQFNNLNFKIVKKNKKIKYWLEGNNILNLNNQKIINIYNKNNFIATDIVNRLAGYLGLGLGYSF